MVPHPTNSTANSNRGQATSTTTNQQGEEESAVPSTIATVSPHQLSRKQQKAKEAQEEQDYVQKLKNWTIMLEQKVNKELFHKVQMFSDTEQTGMGSKWQRVVCKTTEVPKKYRERFWGGVGQALAANKIRQRRINTCTAMKRVFMSEWLGDWWPAVFLCSCACLCRCCCCCCCCCCCWVW
jgi:hypothetical protein